MSKDNFGPGDVVWSGPDGKLEVDKIMKKYGKIPVSTLEVLLASLIKGYRPDLSKCDARKKLLQIKEFLENDVKRGNKPKPDEAMLIELGKRIHAERLYQNPESDKLDVEPLANAVITEFQNLGLVVKQHNIESSARRLVNRFSEEREKHLVLGTIDDHEIVEYLNKIKHAIELLKALGLSADLEPLSHYHPGKLGNKRYKKILSGS